MRKAVLLVSGQEVFCLGERLGIRPDHSREVGTIVTVAARAAGSRIAIPSQRCYGNSPKHT